MSTFKPMVSSFRLSPNGKEHTVHGGAPLRLAVAGVGDCAELRAC